MTEETRRFWNCCSICGASAKDGTFCLNCFCATGKHNILIAEGDVHCPSSAEKKWTLCGLWASVENHPVYKRQILATKKEKVTCGECIRRIEQFEETGVPPRERPL